MKRQCGYRKKGGVYLTVPTSEDGAPVEMFLLDPPQPVELDALGIAPRGVHLIEKEGVWHVFDVVGQDNYPNVSDVIEEARWLGVSRRCELPDYSRLTKESRLVLIHQRAYIRTSRNIRSISPGERRTISNARISAIASTISMRCASGCGGTTWSKAPIAMKRVIVIRSAVSSNAARSTAATANP